MLDRLDKEQKEWQVRIASAKHLLRGSSWREPEGKKEFVRELYGDSVPGYLWYALGKNWRLSQEEIKEISETFWGEKEPSFGDFELHNSHNLEVGTALRVRDAENFATEVTVDGQKCPLYQVGHSVFGEDNKGCVSFLRLY